MLKPACPFLQMLQLLSQPEVRDLCWALSAETDLLTQLPPYKRFPAAVFTLKLKEWLLALDSNPAPLQAHITQQNNSQRLGVYFEQLISFYFLHAPTPSYSLEHHGYRIYEDLPNKGRATVGELDFVLKTIKSSPQELTHLEVAVKFFLGYPQGQQWVWLGPNAKDAWHRKVAHIQNHQLAISAHLNVEHEIDIQHRAFWVKGCFFVPWQMQPHTQATTNAELPTNVNPLVCQNTWLYAHQVNAFLQTQTTKWRVLERKQWLTATPLSPDADASKEKTIEKLLHLTTKNLTKEKQQAVMMVDENTNLSKRVMVVPNNWPNFP